MRTLVRCALAALLLGACGEAPAQTRTDTRDPRPSQATSSTEERPNEAADTRGAPPALPARIDARVGLPGNEPNLSVLATVRLDGLPWTIVGCVQHTHSEACATSARIELTEDQRRHLVTLLGEIHAMPQCTPPPPESADRDYRLAPIGSPVYEGRLPAAEADIAGSNVDACRADARLAWWIAGLVRAAHLAVLPAHGAGPS